MKAFLAALIIFQTAVCVSGFGKSPQKRCLHKINDARAKYAKTHHIANMNELVYNKQLEEDMVAEMPDHQCSVSSVVNKTSLNVFWNMEENSEMINQLLSGTDRTMMACVNRFCVEIGKTVISLIVDSSSSSPIDGSPASGCSRFRTPSQNGLCMLRRSSQRKGLMSILDEFGSAVIDSAKDLAGVAAEVVTLTAQTGEEIVRDAAKLGIDVGEQLIQEGIITANQLGHMGKDVWDKHKKKIVGIVVGSIAIPTATFVGASIGGALGTVTVPVVGTVGFATAGGVTGAIIGASLVDVLAESVKK